MADTFATLAQDALDYARSSELTRAKQYLNDCGRKLYRLDPSPSGTAVSRTVATSKASYDISIDFTIANFVTLDFIEYRSPSSLTRILARQELANIVNLQGTTATGTPYLYGWEGGDVIYIYPQPAVGDTLVFHFGAEWVDMTLDSDTPSGIDAGYWNVLVDYAAYRLAKRDNPELAGNLLADYQRSLIEYKTFLRRRRGQQNRIIPGYPEDIRRNIPHDNSTDYYTAIDY